MASIQKARVKLDQEDIDFYRPVSHKEVLDEAQKEIKTKYKSLANQRKEKPEKA